MSSEVSSYQQGQLIEKEDQKSILMIGGIKVFLPSSRVEADAQDEGAAEEEGQPTETVTKEELGQTSGDTPAEGEEDEHSEEWLKDFSQVAETKTPATLKLRTEEEHADKMLTPWEMELEMLEDWLNHPELVDDYHEETVMQMIAEEHFEESLRNFSQGAEQMMTAALKSAAEGESEF
jgi:hypothetical protein